MWVFGVSQYEFFSDIPIKEETEGRKEEDHEMNDGIEG